jgi:hypothetical protein
VFCDRSCDIRQKRHQQAAGALSGASNLFISCHFIELLPQVAGGFKVIGLPISFVATTDFRVRFIGRVSGKVVGLHRRCA